jgi:hypothetical protein
MPSGLSQVSPDETALSELEERIGVRLWSWIDGYDAPILI